MCDTSIIICCFNRAQYIGRAIRSCQKQQGNFEIIVVDDGSTDNSRKVIESFDGITRIFLDKNGGVAHASNVGIKKANGAFVIRVDADDYISENTILFLSEILMKNPDIGFTYSDHYRVDAQENKERVNLTSLDKILNHGAGILFRKSYLEAIGLYDEEFEQAEDYDLIKRYLKNFDGYHLPMPLYNYFQWEGNMTKKGIRNEYISKADQR